MFTAKRIHQRFEKIGPRGIPRKKYKICSFSATNLIGQRSFNNYFEVLSLEGGIQKE
jgi:hypothetical protein